MEEEKEGEREGGRLWVSNLYDSAKTAYSVDIIFRSHWVRSRLLLTFLINWTLHFSTVYTVVSTNKCGTLFIP